MSDIQLARIPAGALPPQRGRPPVRVEAFEIGVYPVTEEQLAEILGVTAAHPRRPAVGVSWLRAVRFCNAVSEWEGFEPAYRVDGDEVARYDDAEGYRLPTEAEWELACRAGSAAPQYGPLPEIAWTVADGVRTPQPVGARLPNLNGLFDILGNVWEWCEDVVDEGREEHAIRGGGFADDAWSVRADVRRAGPRREGAPDVGFRVARSL
ncbi:formylglycine-generating enzyme family protein [Microbacterium sp. SORGH_AS_0888]|uniref:formylglycine-generating enzyme family protein n=1 Tax=Microbacterium sp. SORGH_AS_0888 TaxID=3041791 RepID=UPI002784A526|nr:formylglycine-generating enzyme family protein [Microbacterium sp. SORGH_AS_0888]MDQ1130196.1 sulfatase modifying factor 1 [Microbacterium sp. SORGH_AS_0888]